METLAPPVTSVEVPLWRRLRRRAFAGSVRGIAGLVAGAPRPLAVGSLRALAALAWVTRRGDRAVSLRQLRAALPDAPATRHRDLARASLFRLADNLVDCVRADRPVVLPATDRERFAELAAGDRPVLFLTAHLGAWELLGRFLARGLGRLGVLTANPHNDAVYQWLRASREAHGLRTFDRDREARAAARWLARGRPLAILADLRSRGATVEVDWFGRPAPTLVSPGRWAQRFGARMVPAGIRRHGDGHEVFLGPEVDVDPAADPREMARRANAGLEALILRAPDEWVWFHDRTGRRGR